MEEEEIEKAPIDGEKIVEEQKKPEDAKTQKDEFEKNEELVSAGKYNSAVRKQRELELELRELRNSKEIEKPVKKVIEDEEEEMDEDEDDEDFFTEKPVKKTKSDDPNTLAKDVEDLKSRLDQREADDKKKQITTFFKAYPEYKDNSEKWLELLDVLDESINPHSKHSFYQQLVMARRLISNDTATYNAIEKKKAEMASETASKGDGAEKAPDNSKKVDERAMRLAKNMPRGYEFKVN